MNLRTINLNLLKTLRVLLQTRSVTAASRELFLTQPAVSTALKQLRDLFQDPLFIKGQNGSLTLTHKAETLQPKLEQLLRQAENLIGSTEEKIDLEKLDDTFHIGVHSHVGFVIFPKLYEALKKIAPHVKIQQTGITSLSEFTSKELYRFDFIIGSFGSIPRNYIREFYFSDQFVFLSGVKELNTKEKITLKDLNTYDHVVLSHINNYTKTLGEKLLTENAIKRRYKMIVSDAALAAELAETQSALLLILKKRADYLKNRYALKLFQCPFTSRDLKIDIIYKESDADNPVKKWFKSVLFNLI